jgi:PhnB protein
MTSKIPSGYHSIAPYLIVPNSLEAIAFYQKAFNAIEKMRLEMPDGSIGHAEIIVGNSVVMLGAASQEMNTKSPADFGGSPASLHFYVENADAMVAQAVRAGATLLKPVEDMFWGDRAGRVQDPFGYQWMISHHVEEVPMEEIQKRLRKGFGG